MVAVKYFQNIHIALQLSKLDPIIQINNMEFEYAHFFNRLSIEDQKFVINNIVNSDQNNIKKIKTNMLGKAEIFEPILLFFTKNQVHLIGYFSSKWTKPEIEWDQGHINSLLIVSKNGYKAKSPNDMLLESYSPATKTHILFYVNDFEWKNKYKMYSLPMPLNFESADFFKVEAVKIKAKSDGIIEDFEQFSVDIFENK